MANISYYKHNWTISWFNIKNVDEDEYAKKFNEAYQKNKKSYFKKVLHLLYKETGIELTHKWDQSHIVWITSKNLYWCIFRKSNNVFEKGKWCFKLIKSDNDHCGCGC